MKKIITGVSVVLIAAFFMAATSEWTTNIPTLAGQISTEYPQIEKNFEELEEILAAITNGTVGTTDTANYEVDVVASDVSLDGAIFTEGDAPTTAANEGGVYSAALDGATALWFATESEGEAIPFTNSYRRGEFFRAKFSWKDDDEIYLDDGSYLVKDKWAWWDGQLTEQIAAGSPDASDWYYIYLDHSAITSGTEITATEIINSTTEPSWSADYRGWYNGDDLCIFAVYSDSGSEIDHFWHNGERVAVVHNHSDMALTDIDLGTWTDVTITLPVFTTQGNVAFLSANCGAGEQAVFYWAPDTYGSAGAYVRAVHADVDGVYVKMNYQDVFTSSSQVIEVTATASNDCELSIVCNGWYFPRGM